MVRGVRLWFDGTAAYGLAYASEKDWSQVLSLIIDKEEVLFHLLVSHQFHRLKYNMDLWTQLDQELLIYQFQVGQILGSCIQKHNK